MIDDDDFVIVLFINFCVVVENFGVGFVCLGFFLGDGENLDEWNLVFFFRFWVVFLERVCVFVFLVGGVGILKWGLFLFLLMFIGVFFIFNFKGVFLIFFYVMKGDLFIFGVGEGVVI